MFVELKEVRQIHDIVIKIKLLPELKRVQEFQLLDIL